MSREYLRNKSDGVKDSVKWIESKIKDEQKELKDNKYSYWGDVYDNKMARIDAMIELKIELEKYSKKLRHEADELDCDDYDEDEYYW